MTTVDVVVFTSSDRGTTALGSAKVLCAWMSEAVRTVIVADAGFAPRTVISVSWAWVTCGFTAVSTSVLLWSEAEP